MKTKPTTTEKIKTIKSLIAFIDDKINELQKHQRDLIKELEALKREIEFERMYD